MYDLTCNRTHRICHNMQGYDITRCNMIFGKWYDIIYDTIWHDKKYGMTWHDIPHMTYKRKYDMAWHTTYDIWKEIWHDMTYHIWHITGNMTWHDIPHMTYERKYDMIWHTTYDIWKEIWHDMTYHIWNITGNMTWYNNFTWHMPCHMKWHDMIWHEITLYYIPSSSIPVLLCCTVLYFQYLLVPILYSQQLAPILYFKTISPILYYQPPPSLISILLQMNSILLLWPHLIRSITLGVGGP